MRGIYQRQEFDKSSMQEVRYFIFKNIDTEKDFAIRENALTKVSPKFNNRNILYVVYDCDIPICITDERYAYFSVSERKIQKIDMFTNEEIKML